MQAAVFCRILQLDSQTTFTKIKRQIIPLNAEDGFCAKATCQLSESGAKHKMYRRQNIRFFIEINDCSMAFYSKYCIHLKNKVLFQTTEKIFSRMRHLHIKNSMFPSDGRMWIIRTGYCVLR